MEQQVSVNKRQKNLTRDELENFEKDELINKIIQLQAYNFQLKNILQKKLSENTGVGVESDSESVSNSKGTKRQFDFSKCNKRHVLLKILYFGWDYQGLACQEDSNATIEFHLFKALSRTCLIESRATSNYHRCGRTDKEVSAFCQVISIDLRSKYNEEEQLTDDAIRREIDYCGLLNRVLPKNIQCIAWMPLRSKVYSARFDCKNRTYRYYFPAGELDLDSMRAACQLLSSTREADFRNLCKMDVHNGVMNYKRRIYSALIHECLNQGEDGSYRMCYFEIRANSFLWHQIRCIMAVLFLIGEGKEDPDVINELLNIDCNPCKPQYTPAAALPLNLFNCEFRQNSVQPKKDCAENNESPENASRPDDDEEPVPDITTWFYNEENLNQLIETIQGEWTQFSVKSMMIRDVLLSLENLVKQLFDDCDVNAQANVLHECVRPKQHQKLMTRKRCESLENRIQHFVKKQRLIVKENSNQ